MKRYNPKEIEPRWQKTWADKQLYKAVDFENKRPKFVMLTEFPYPSGEGLHMGHVREYSLGDVIARHKRMTGHNVLYPMGYDSFGLPTENYAIKNKVAPQVATTKNISIFQKQFESLGYSIDWSRSFSTTDPDYYKWTQWLFLQFFKKGLAYQDEIAINWCPKCKTGLANEEVINGRHERCDTPVEKKLLKQWLLKITKYADRLIDGLQNVDYPSRIADQQINWIGRSRGAEVDFEVDGGKDKIRVFTTRPDTLFGATFMVLAPEHPLVKKITTTDQKDAVEKYVKTAQTKTDIERQETEREKTGVFTGAYAINPVNGAKIPIWVADYVLMGYGTGAIMAVPAHDIRDIEFARKFELPIIPVILPQTDYCVSYVMGQKRITKTDIEKLGGSIVGTTESGHLEVLFPKSSTEKFEALISEKMEPGFWNEYIGDEAVFIFKHKDGKLQRFVLNEQTDVQIRKLGHQFNDQEDSDESVWQWLGGNRFYGDYFSQNTEGIIVNSGKYNGLPSSEMREKIVADLVKAGKAEEQVNYKLRDWIFSRQHYWGEPIPIIHCEKDGAVPVPDKDLPVELPKVDHYEPTETGESPLAAITDWVNVKCPKCGGPAKRETDTMPNWAGSSWYYLRYFDAHNDKVFADRKKLDYWGEVDIYLGGMEHTTLHLLYSRFWHQFFYDQGLVPTQEPYKARRGQGIILAADGSKMSKSKGNIVNPTSVIEQGYGADALRLSIVFLAPYDQTTPWSTDGVAGNFRFLQRYWTIAQEYLEKSDSPTAKQPNSPETKDLLSTTNKAIFKVSKDIEAMNFNTAVAALMEALNSLYKIKADQGFADESWQWALETFTKLLAPFAPHITEEIWHDLGQRGSVHTSEWPVHDEKYLVSDTMTIVVQVNGKVRANLELPTDSSEDQVVTAAKAEQKVASYLAGHEIRKTIYVPKKLVSFVV